MGALTGLDMITLLLVGGGLVLGFMRGFITEILSLLSWVAAILALKFLHEPLAEALEGPIGTSASCSSRASSSRGASVLPPRKRPSLAQSTESSAEASAR
jgi:hypothetical protein